jgi:hypothetical protein
MPYGQSPSRRLLNHPVRPAIFDDGVFVYRSVSAANYCHLVGDQRHGGVKKMKLTSHFSLELKQLDPTF